MNASRPSPHFIILGASLDTGNLGVSALLAATVKCIRHAHADARISLLEGSRRPGRSEVFLSDHQVIRLGCLGVRCNKTIWRRNHVLRLLLTAAILRVIPIRGWRQRLLSPNPYLHAITSAEGVLDITGGDSFSDLYGLRRLILMTSCKLLVLVAGANLTFLPQTYGPFKRRLARMIARALVCRASALYSRDRESLSVLADLIGSRRRRATPEFSPDVAFVLDAVAPQEIHTTPGPLPPRGRFNLIGINVSGLLYNGGYSRNNMFNLRCDYPSLVRRLAIELLAQENVGLLLIPHVFVPSGHVESDADACHRIFEAVVEDYPDRVFVLEGTYNENEIKYIVGQCDFFLGSRMHACIAAVSQGIPTMPLAYSRKFRGVFDSVGLAELVIDLREIDANTAIKQVIATWTRRGEIAELLKHKMPTVKAQVLRLFEDGIPCAVAEPPPTLSSAGPDRISGEGGVLHKGPQRPRVPRRDDP